MSYIPDTRHKMKTDYCGNQTDELNPYWYRNLEGDDATELFGYDWAMNQVELSLDTYLENEGFDDEVQRQEIIKIVLECLESSRDETVVSMIDNMEQADYDRRFDEVADLVDDEQEDDV